MKEILLRLRAVALEASKPYRSFDMLTHFTSHFERERAMLGVLNASDEGEKR
jgi:hypothetical protein